MAINPAELDTFPKLLRHHARERGERPAIREKSRGIWRTMTWRHLADEVEALAAALSEQGLQRGAHVALVGDNRPRLFAAMCAAQWLGAIALPLYQDASAAEMVPSIQSAEVTHIFAENQEQVDKLLEMLPRCPSVRCIIYDKVRGMGHYNQPQLVSYASLLQQGRELVAARRDLLQAEAERGTGEDAAFLFYTSGTTGPAKGVVLSHISLIDRASKIAATERLKDTDVALAYLPPGWIGQNLFSYVQPMVVGYCVCCPESSETMLADMREIGPTYLLATPRMLATLISQVQVRLEDAGRINRALYRGCMALARRVGPRILSGERVFPGARLAYAVGSLLIYGPLCDVLGMSKVRVAYTAGDAIAPSVLIFFRALGINLKQLYGSTETGFLVAMQRDGQVKPDTVGTASEGVELKVTPQHEILVRSRGLFKEYLRDPEATRQVKNAEGWFHTGDIGYLGEDGQLRVIDCKENVGALKDGTPYAPRMLENRLKQLPYIKEAVAFGDGRDMVCVFVDIDMEIVGRWADKRGISHKGHADLASRDEVYGMIADCIARVNADLAREQALGNAQIRRFLILPKELDADDGVLTRTGKLRRGAIAELYAPLVAAMYDGRTEARIEFSSNLADASPAEIKIREARVVTSPLAKRVA
jgi:long-chain acyl-CoA synthetase